MESIAMPLFCMMSLTIKRRGRGNNAIGCFITRCVAAELVRPKPRQCITHYTATVVIGSAHTSRRTRLSQKTKSFRARSQSPKSKIWPRRAIGSKMRNHRWRKSKPELPVRNNAAMKSTKAAVIFVLVTVTLDMLTVGLIVPVLPKLILDFLGGDMKSAADWNGVFGTVFAAMQFFFSPMLGVLSDLFGRRPTILLSNLGLGLDYFVMALAPTLGWLFLGRVISGITSASIPTAMAYIADVTPREKRAGAFGLIGVAFGIGFVLGPAVGGLLGNISVRLPFWVVGGFSLANWAWGYF